MQPYSLGLAGSANDGYVNEEELCLPKMNHNIFEKLIILCYRLSTDIMLKGFTHDLFIF